jgi:hypothetical protein
MADSLEKNLESSKQKLNAYQEKELKLLEEQIKLEEKLSDLQSKKDAASKKELKSTKEQLEASKRQLSTYDAKVKAAEKLVKKAEKHLAINVRAGEELASMVHHFQEMPEEIQKQIAGVKKMSNLFNEIQATIAKQKAIMEFGDENEIKAAEKKNELYASISEEILHSSKHAADAQRELNEMLLSDLDKRALIIAANKDLHEDERQRAIDGLHYADLLNKKAEALHEVQHSSGHIFHAIDDDLQSSVKGAASFAKTMFHAGAGGALLLGVFTALAAGVHSFVELDAAAEQFRKDTGLTKDNLYEVDHTVHDVESEFRGIGVTAKDVYKTVEELKNRFGDITQFSTETVAALSAMNANYGLVNGTAEKVQAVFEQVGGLSQETAASVQMQVAEMSKMAGVSPKEVLDDMADSAEVTSKYFHGDINLLKQQVIQAHRLGTTLEDVASIAGKLVDFEQGIESELKAATFVGGQFNLARARALAFEGKLVEAQEETLKQLQRSGDFRDKDMITQQVLADAAGMTVAQITKQLDMQEKMSHLTDDERKKADDAVKAGLDLSNISKENLKQKVDEFKKQQDINGQITEMKNQFLGIAAQVGGVLAPLFKSLAPILEAALTPVKWMIEGFGKIVEFAKEHKGIAITLGTIMASIWAYQKATALWAQKDAFFRLLSIRRAGMLAAVSALSNPFKALIGLAVAATVVGAVSSLSSGAEADGGAPEAPETVQTAGDVISPAKGRTQISTKEGGLLNLSKNDDVLAGPGLTKESADNLKYAQIAGMSGVGAGVGVMLLVQEIKQMRKEMASKSNDVYMDGSKVSSNLKNQSDKTSRNNGSLA